MTPLHRSFLLAVTVVVLLLAGCDSTANEAEPEEPVDPRIRLESRISMIGPNMIHSDVWGYVDPATGKEYALVGGLGAGGTLYIVDASDPARPVHVATVNVPGFDIKVWGHFAYTVTGGGDGGLDPEGRIVDLSDPAHPVVVGAFPSSHNLFIDDRGFMYLEIPGLRIMDLNDDPVNPEQVWSDGQNGGHDATVVGNRLFDFHGRGGTNIYDVSSRSNPQRLGSITLPSISYHHSGWTTSDGNYLLVCDELSQAPTADITVWDIRDPSDPTLVAEIGDDQATVHNLYIIDNLAYVSYYAAGFRLYDLTDPTQPRLVDEFDTEPATATPGFTGAWGAYPFTPSGAIYVSDMRNGLHIFSLER
ncbi:MAG: LVIVD repeat-containing protein [Rhodothermales bacterium]